MKSWTKFFYQSAKEQQEELIFEFIRRKAMVLQFHKIRGALTNFLIIIK